MSDTLVVAISQSGHHHRHQPHRRPRPRPRGARSIAIVNRRNSDLTDKADGVLYTSDGRDVEMSVASTKAFYAQIAAGFLLACAIAERRRAAPARRRARPARRRCASCPTRWRPSSDAGRRSPRPPSSSRPPRRYWAIVGNGSNRIAAEELRIKLSELCYKSIACDATEDKKHIDLSSEPLILVCAAGLTGSNADDVAKEVAIYRAHKATPIVIATEGEERFAAALQAVITVPPVHPSLAFVLSAMAGHLFGYEAALAIDAPGPAAARGARRDRGGGVEADGRATATLLGGCAPRLEPLAARFFDGLRTRRLRRPPRGEHGGAARVAVPLRARQSCRSTRTRSSTGKVGTPSVVVEDLTSALTRGIEELTRPVDAIKHQAKTVTVGISRRDETLLAGAARAGGARRRRRPRPPQLQGAAHARRPRSRGRRGHRLHPLPHRGRRRRRRRGRSSRSSTAAASAATSRSRTERNPRLRGTKHRVAIEREVMAARGRADGRTLVIVPEVKDTDAHRPHAAARALRRPPPRRDGSRRCSRATAAATARSRTRSPRPSRPSATTCSARSTSSTCSPSRSSAWPTAGAPDLFVIRS